jgi:hypothetical protein
MLFHSEFKMIPRRQGGSSGGVYEDTLSMLTTRLTQAALEGGMESIASKRQREAPSPTTPTMMKTD